MAKLYIVEGLPCSGKSTAARYIADTLEKGDQTVRFYDEGTGEHPADYEFHAYILPSELSAFSAEEQEEIMRHVQVKSDGIVLPLSAFSGSLFDKLLQHKIYDFLPWETEKPLMLDKWRTFVKQADVNAVYVFNCVFLQNPMCETMMRFNLSYEESLAYIREIAEIIAPLDPCVVYLKNDDIAERIEYTAKEREGWLDTVIDYHINGSYGKSINAQGFEGYISCLEERQKRELRILAQLPVQSIVIDNMHRDYEEAYEKIKTLISLCPPADPKLPRL